MLAERIGAATRYAMLVTSLPHMATLFGAEQTPISRLRLDQRLRLLEPDDAARLALIEDLVAWDRMPLGSTDAEVVEEAIRTLDALDDDFLGEVVGWRLELRTIIAALRRRRLGLEPPDPDRTWGFGRHVSFIGRHWTEPGFGLGGALPWIGEAAELLSTGQTVALERLLLGLAWDHLGRLGADHHFDFEAVVVYVLRWQLVARWTAHAAAAATQRFERLVDDALAGVSIPFAPSEIGDA